MLRGARLTDRCRVATPDAALTVPTRTGFQFEVGMANLGIGVIGNWCAFTSDRGSWLATIVMTTTFLVGAAAGHLREMITKKNFAVNNAGFIFYWDLVMPAVLIALYVATP